MRWWQLLIINLAECVGINQQATPHIISSNLFWFITAFGNTEHDTKWTQTHTHTHTSPPNKAHKYVSQSFLLKLRVEKKPNQTKMKYPTLQGRQFFQSPAFFMLSLEFHKIKILGGWIPTFQKEPHLSTERFLLYKHSSSTGKSWETVTFFTASNTGKHIHNHTHFLL